MSTVLSSGSSLRVFLPKFCIGL